MWLVLREDGVAVINPSEDVALEITVTNRGGEEAHQTHSVINLPDTLRYSSVVYSTTAVSAQEVCVLEEQHVKHVFTVCLEYVWALC